MSSAMTMRYMERFRCIAERCEDTCCGGLALSITRQRLELMRSRMAGSPEGERLERALRHAVENDPASPQVLLHTESTTDCTFLDPDRLCSLQRAHGEQVLPDMCSLYPRHMAQRQDRLELSATLACPEVARLVLLAEDALELTELPLEQVPRPELAKAGEEHWYGLPVSELRNTLMRLMQRRDLPLDARLTLLSLFCFHLDVLVTQSGGQQADPAQVGPQLAEMLRMMEQPQLQQQLQQRVEGATHAGVFNLKLFLIVLHACRALITNPRFTRWSGAVLEGLGTGDSLELEQLEPAWQQLVARARHLESLHGARFHQYFSHAFTAKLWSMPLPGPIPLTAVALFRIFRLLLLRVGLLCHPQVAALCAQPPESAEQARALLDAAAVETFQIYSKYMESAPSVLNLGFKLANTEGGLEGTLFTGVQLARLFSDCRA